MRRTLTFGLSVVLAMCGLLMASAVATPVAKAGGYVAPLKFYQSAPHGWQEKSVGTLLKYQRERHSCYALRSLKGYRVMYVSRGALGEKVFETGMVYFPVRGHAPVAGRPVVAFGHGTCGVGDEACPSRYPCLYPYGGHPAWDDYAQWVGQIGRMGYIMTCPDYEGLGTPGLHPFLNAGSEGRSMIDAVRAARHLAKRLGIRVSTSWGATGHSSGGQAALAASELATTYGKGLKLAGTVPVSPAIELGTILSWSATEVSNYPYCGYAAWGARALTPSLDFATICGPWILPVIDQAPDKSWYPWWDTLYGAHLSADGVPLTPGPGDVFAAGYDKTAAWQKFISGTNTTRKVLTGPVLVLIGTEDDFYKVLPTFENKQLAMGAELTALALAGQDHDSALDFGWPWAKAFFEDKLPVN